MAKFTIDGEEVEVAGALTQADAEALVEKAKKDLEDAHKKELETIQEDHKKKLAEKTGQIKLLRDLSDDEKSKMTAKEIEDAGIRQRQFDEIELNKKEIGDLKKSQIDTFKSSALDALGIYGEEDRKKALIAYDRIVGDMKTPEEVRSKMGEAVNMSGLAQNRATGFRAPMGSGSFPNHSATGDKTFADTPDGQDLAGKLGLGFIKEKK